MRTSIIKENAGAAQRERQRQKHQRYIIAITLLLISTFLFHAWIVKGSNGATGGDTRERGSGHSTRRFRSSSMHKGAIRAGRAQYSEIEKLELVLTGQVHLVDITISPSSTSSDPYDNTTQVIGYFCHVDWIKYKQDPSSYPFFRDLVDHSDKCTKHDRFPLNLYPLIQHAKEYDMQHPTTIKSLPPRGFIFNEGRCGSTLIANSLVAMDPSKSRVYSEGAPILNSIIACGLEGAECPNGLAKQLFRDVVYLLGRTNDLTEEYLFIKIHYEGSKYIDIATNAFPETPWIYLYRDPVQVMMSQLAKDNSCIHKRHHIPSWGQTFLQDNGYDFDSFTPVQVCAFYLQTLCESAYRAIQSSHGRGVGLNYNDKLMEKFVQTILPNHFHIPISSGHERRIAEVNQHYSKSTDDHPKKGSWAEDSSTKSQQASKQIRKACDEFLYRSFHDLETVSI